MKFGKSYPSPSFPPNWRANAIRYKELKKVISRLQEELEELGLGGQRLGDVQVVVEKESSTVVLRNQEEREGDRDKVKLWVERGGNVQVAYVVGGTVDDPRPRLRIHFLPPASDADRQKRETIRISEEEAAVYLSYSRHNRSHSRDLVRRIYEITTYDTPNESEQESEDVEHDIDGDNEESTSAVVSPITPPTDISPVDDKDATNLIPNDYDSLPDDVYISLKHDREFFSQLSQALSGLVDLRRSQGNEFTSDVAELSMALANVPSFQKADIYTWRQIFALWVQAQIFESSLEKDRGRERTPEEAKEKLDWFVDQVSTNHLGKKMKGKNGKVLLEQFINLNVQLLDIKNWDLVNEEAARKILKKHDKRTALTASVGFPPFYASTFSLIGTPSSNHILTFPGSHSLSHILLASITSQLLPVIPALEDYSCPICGDLAFKPIRLDCSHLFCLRCLVKMQKRQQDSCPACRAKVVMRATGANLDEALLRFLLEWFPKESKEKRKQNSKEIDEEREQEMGLPDVRCSIM